MSLIRCLSNPEGLYAWENNDGAVTFTQSGSPLSLMAAIKDVDEVFCRYCEEDFATEAGISTETVSVVETDDHRIQMTFHDHNNAAIIMYEVTFAYMARSHYFNRIAVENRELRRELARVQQLPEADWLSVTSVLTQCLATLSRSGNTELAKHGLAALDRGMVYVNRLSGDRAELKKTRPGRGTIHVN